MYDGYISLLCSRNGQVSDDIYIYPLLVHLIKKHKSLMFVDGIICIR